MSHGASAFGHAMPFSSASCSTAAAAIRAGPDAVGAHPDQLLAAALVEVRRAERLRESRAELEDVADLDRRLDRDLVAVDRVAGFDGAHVAALEGEVAPRLDAAQVVVGLVRADDVAAVLHGVVEQHRDVRADRADEARRADPVADLLVVGGPERGAERVGELDLVDAMVAAHEHEHEAATVRDDRKGLQQRPRVGTPRRRATSSIVVAPGVCTRSGSGSGGGSSTGCASAVATSTLAA